MRSGASPRLGAMAGRAVLTMVESSVCMKKPVATSHSMIVSAWGEGVDVTFERIVSGMKVAGGGGGGFLRGDACGLRAPIFTSNNSHLRPTTKQCRLTSTPH